MLAFYGMYEGPVLLSVIASSYMIFVVTSLADTPFVYFSRLLKRDSAGERQKMF